MTLSAATYLLVVLFALAGGLALGAAITNAQWFFGAANTRMLTSRISHTAARIIYGVAGVAILAMAAHLALHIQ